MSKLPIRVAIVEDQRIFSQLLALLLRKILDCDIVGTAHDGESGWELCLATKPELVMLDIEMPRLDGLQMASRLLSQLPDTRLLVMSGLTDPYTIWRVTHCGAYGYLDKSLDLDSWSKAIHEVSEGRRYFSPVVNQVKADWLSQPEAFQKILSEREQEVLRWVVGGSDDARIATELDISPATVEAHRKHIRQKLELHNDRDLVAYARKWGLSPPNGRI